MLLSIIIPVVNEEDNIGRLLQYLQGNSSEDIPSETLVVDGGSTDKTAKIVKSFSGVKFLTSEKGRAKQMNFGVNQSKGEIFYFLHADSLPPKDFDRHIINAFVKGKFAGCFQMKFDSNHWWLKLMGHFTRINHKSCRGGDQSLFVTKKLFTEIGGFDESFIIYEDNDFIGKLYRKGHFSIINKWLTTSARKYQEVGVWNLQKLYVEIYFKKWRGANAKELIEYYDKRIGQMS